MLGAAVRVSSQRLAGCGAVGPPLRSLPPPSLPREVARAPLSRCTVGGAWVGGPGSARGGAPRHHPPPTLPRLLSGPTGHGRHLCRCLRGGWGCGGGGFRRRERQWVRASRKARGSQLLASASVMRSTATPPRKAGHVASLSDHAARYTARRTLSWSTGAAHPPMGYLPVPPVPLEEHGIEGPVPHPPGGPRAGPAQPPVHLHHQGDGLIPQGVRDRAQVPVPGPGPPAPRAGSPCGACAWGASAAPCSPAPRQPSSVPAPPSARGGLAGAWVVGVGGG